MKFFTEQYLTDLTHDQVTYITDGINEILDKENIVGSKRSKYFDVMFVVWGTLEYRDAHLQDPKQNTYIKNYYTKERNKEEIKEHFANKKAQLVFPHKSEYILSQKESWGLSHVGKHIITQALDILFNYAIFERAVGNKALDKKGKVKQIIITTGLNEYLDKPEYQSLIYNTDGYMTTFTYRARRVHMINGLNHYENEEPMVIIKDPETGNKRPASKHLQALSSRINAHKRKMKLSINGHDMRSERIFTDNEQRNGRYYNSFQNLSKEERKKIGAKEGLTEEYDKKNAKFHVMAIASGTEMQYDDVYVEIVRQMGYSAEFAKQHRKVFKEASQVLLQPMSEQKRLLAVINIFAKNGLIISKRKYKNNENTQFDFLNKERLVEAINNKDWFNYPEEIKRLAKNKIMSRRLLYGKIRTLHNKFMNKEDFFYDKTRTIIANRDNKNKIESFTIFHKNGEIEEQELLNPATNIFIRQTLQTFYNIMYFRKENNITTSYQEVDPLLFINTFITMFPKIIQIVETKEMNYMFIESEITSKIENSLVNKNIHTINIHDGFQCSKEDYKKVEEIVIHHYTVSIYSILEKIIKNIKDNFIGRFLKKNIDEFINTSKNMKRHPDYRDRFVREVSGYLIDEYDDIREELEKQLLDLPEDNEEYKSIMEVLDEMPVWMEPIDIAYHALNGK